MNISAILAEAKRKSPQAVIDACDGILMGEAADPQASPEEIRAVNLARLEAVAQVKRRGRR